MNECEAVLVNTVHPTNSELPRALCAFLFTSNKDIMGPFAPVLPWGPLDGPGATTTNHAGL